MPQRPRCRASSPAEYRGTLAFRCVIMVRLPGRANLSRPAPLMSVNTTSPRTTRSGCCRLELRIRRRGCAVNESRGNMEHRRESTKTGFPRPHRGSPGCSSTSPRVGMTQWVPSASKPRRDGSSWDVSNPCKGGDTLQCIHAENFQLA